MWLTYWQKDAFNADVNFYQGIYAAFGIASAALTLFAGMAITCMSIHASYVLFTNMLRHVWFSPMSFFDTVPLGRLMGVFGKDTDSLDNDLPEMWTYAMMFAAQVCSCMRLPLTSAYWCYHYHHRQLSLLPRHVSEAVVC